MSFLWFEAEKFDLRTPDGAHQMMRELASRAAGLETIQNISDDQLAAKNGRKMKIAYASRTSAPRWTPFCLKVLPLESEDGKEATLDEISECTQLFPADKTMHLKNIAEALHCDLNEMLFFDNESRNITTANRVGVPAYECSDGLSWPELVNGLIHYHTRTLDYMTNTSVKGEV